MLIKHVKAYIQNGFLRNISIKGRLLLYFLFLVLLPTSVISTTVYYKSKSIMTQRVGSSIRKSLDTVEINIMQKFEYINDICTFIYMNPELVKILSSKHPENRMGLINEISTLDRILEAYNAANITKTLLIPKLFVLNRPEYLQFNFSDKVFYLGAIDTEKWYKDLPPRERYTIIGLGKEMTASCTVDTIKFAKRLFGLKNSQIPYSALLTVDIGIQEFNDILRECKPSENSLIYLVDKDCTVVASSDDTFLRMDLKNENYVQNIIADTNGTNEFFIENIGKANMFVSYKKIDSLKWTVILLSPTNELYGELLSFQKVIYTVILICMVSAVAFALLLSENVSHPIRKLAKSMSLVRKGNFDITLDYKRNDEFSYLVNAYEKMVRELKELISKIRVIEEDKREAELKALQSQINPHFLYNTLDSINWLSLKHKVPDISIMVTSLSDFFRYSLSKGKSIILLNDEKLQVESYLAIQKIRFKDKLDYSVEMPQDILNYYTVKLILQPLVENSLVHGIEKKSQKGYISIKARKLCNVIEITISDNGVGADVEELNRILERKSSSSSFGIRNVDDRIKHFFGNEFGIRYERNGDCGILAVVRIPAVSELEGYNVENDFSR